VKRFSFSETDAPRPGEEPGFKAFLQDASLSGTATEEELEFLRRLTFTTKRPTPLYFHRELQSFRDPLRFRPA
jgi:hypothetical protein